MQTFFKRHQKTIIWIVVGIFIISAGLVTLNQAGLFSGSSSRETASGALTYVATVDGTEISVEAFDTAWRNTLEYYSNLYQQIGMDFNDMLDGVSGVLYLRRLEAQVTQDLIRQAVLDNEARRRGINAPSDEVQEGFDAQYAQYVTYYGDELTDVVQGALGITLVQFQQRLRDGIATQIRNELVREAVVGVIDPSEEQLRSYYELNIIDYDQPEEVRASHILVADRDLADQLRTELLAGADFAELATAYSEDAGSRESGGDLGWFGRGQMVSEFEEAAFSLASGEISDVVETDYGYHLILVTDRREHTTPSFADVEDDVRADYIEQQQTDIFAAWVDGAVDSADVVIAIPEINAYLLQLEDPDLGLAEFERLRDGNLTDDPYVDYYIGSIYESKMNAATQDLAALEAIEEQVELSQIVVGEESLAEDLRARLAEGASFAELAQEYSTDAATAADGGALGFVSRSDLTDQLAEVAFALAIDSPSEVLATEDAYVILLVTDATPGASEEDLAQMAALEADIERYRNAALESYLVVFGEGIEDEQFLEEILQLDPDDTQVLFRLGKLLLEDESDVALNEAEARFLQVLALDPEHVASRIGLGDVFAARGDFENAIVHYELALELWSDDTSLMLKLAEAYIAVGELEAGGDLLDQIDEVIASTTGLQTLAATVQSLRGNMALASLETAVSARDALVARGLSVDSPEVVAADEVVATLAGEAIGAYEDALLSSGSGTQQRLQLGTVYLLAGEAMEAERTFREAIRQSPYRAEAHKGLGDALMAQGQEEEAVESYRDAFLYAFDPSLKAEIGTSLVSLLPEDLTLRFQLASVLEELEDWDGAIRQYGAVLNLSADDLEAYTRISAAYELRGDLETARDYAQRGADRAPTASTERSFLGRVVELDRLIVGEEQSLSTAGQDAMIRLAEMDIEIGDAIAARTRLEELRTFGTYRSEDVERLAGIVETLLAPIGSGTLTPDAQTGSNVP
ncbi:peptidylprolyl isomerase [Candidatus Bipolaricaulota bacterium]|nr:peptidylprolyl isomerase [Candidatus Bipolaricaulota bacterium]